MAKDIRPNTGFINFSIEKDGESVSVSLGGEWRHENGQNLDLGHVRCRPETIEDAFTLMGKQLSLSMRNRPLFKKEFKRNGGK